MEALKKTSVAAMIMVICIVMAVLLGEMRSGTYKQVEETGVVTQQKDNPKHHNDRHHRQDENVGNNRQQRDGAKIVSTENDRGTHSYCRCAGH